MKKLIVLLFLILGCVFAKGAYAASYDLIAPTGQLTRGQDVQFTINIDTQGQSLTSASIGMTYSTDILQYVSATPGDTFSTLSPETQEGGKIILNASNGSGFSGTGTFAVVTFKLIAQSAGSTELCVLFNPETPTQPPAPTSLPQTGSAEKTNRGIMLGVTLFVLAAGILITYNRKPYTRPHATHHKTLH